MFGSKIESKNHMSEYWKVKSKQEKIVKNIFLVVLAAYFMHMYGWLLKLHFEGDFWGGTSDVQWFFLMKFKLGMLHIWDELSAKSFSVKQKKNSLLF